MSRERLYWTTLERPSRRFAPSPLRLHLRWDGHEQAFVHKPSGATLEGLLYAAKKRGHRYAIDYPAARRATFTVLR